MQSEQWSTFLAIFVHYGIFIGFNNYLTFFQEDQKIIPQLCLVKRGRLAGTVEATSRSSGGRGEARGERRSRVERAIMMMNHALLEGKTEGDLPRDKMEWARSGERSGERGVDAPGG